MSKYLNKLILVLTVLLCGTQLVAQRTHTVSIHAIPILSSAILETKYISPSLAGRMGSGIDYSVSLNEEFFAGIGFTYKVLGYNNRNFEYRDEQGNTIGTGVLLFYRHFIEIPANISYTIHSSDNSKLFIDLSLINQFLFRLKSTTNQNFFGFPTETSYSDLKNMDAKTYNIALNAGCSLESKLNSSMFIQFSPFMQYSILNMNNIHDFALGLKIGLGYTFPKKE